MADQCEECHAEDVRLYIYWDWLVCSGCLQILQEAERIDQQDAVREDRRLWQK